MVLHRRVAGPMLTIDSAKSRKPTEREPSYRIRRIIDRRNLYDHDSYVVVRSCRSSAARYRELRCGGKTHKNSLLCCRIIARSVRRCLDIHTNTHISLVYVGDLRCDRRNRTDPAMSLNPFARYRYASNDPRLSPFFDPRPIDPFRRYGARERRNLISSSVVSMNSDSPVIIAIK